jgi:hypothetical protein
MADNHKRPRLGGNRAGGTYEETEPPCVLGEGNVDLLLERLKAAHSRRPGLPEAAYELAAKAGLAGQAGKG